MQNIFIQIVSHCLKRQRSKQNVLFINNECYKYCSPKLQLSNKISSTYLSVKVKTRVLE